MSDKGQGVKPLSAHSILEAQLYLMLQGCDRCGGGRLEVVGEQIEDEHIDSTVRLDSECDNCGEKFTARFRIDSRRARPTEPPLINPLVEPSRLIDVAQWLTLYHTLIAKCEQLPDKTVSRNVAYQAGLCLAEALKFYEPDNELPPGSAFFSAHAREQARRQPGFFTREKLLNLQSRVPNLRVSPAGEKPVLPSKWWNFWRKPSRRPDGATPDSV